MSNKTLQNLIGTINELPKYKDISKTLTFDWTEWACAADWHLPFLNIEIFKKFIRECHSRKIKKLVIGGDFFEMSAFSYFFGYTKVAWREEKEVAKKVINILNEAFEEISFIVANHEIRWLRALADKYEGDIFDIYELIGITDTKNITLKNKIIVGDWMIVHPKNARKNSLSLANDLSGLYPDKHMIVTHAHRQAIGKEKSGKRWVIDLGLMADPKQLEYINFNVTTHPMWNPGFLIVQNNIPELFWL